MPAPKRRPRTDGAPRIVATEEILARVQDTLAALERRAFEIFEHRGSPAGSEREDWYHAETQLLHPVGVEIVRAARGWTLRAEVHGFEASEIVVNVEPRRVTLVGERKRAARRTRGEIVVAEPRGERILRFVDLPGEVAAARASVALKGGVLEVTLPGAAAAG
jgi:HSP20 family molecular chaperone IbpA